jgi:manganese oxidase
MRIMMQKLQTISVLALLGGFVVAGKFPSRTAVPAVQPNANTQRAGVLHDGVLTVSLEAQQSQWRIDGPNRPPMTIEAFSESGKQPLRPGPLVRVPQGTEIRFNVRNSLAAPLTFIVPGAVHGGPDRPGAMDTVVIAPGATAQLTTRATVPGNYVYRGRTPGRIGAVLQMTGLLGGALVVDTAAAPGRPTDRILVIMATPDSAGAALLDTNKIFNLDLVHTVYTINGRSWPKTEHIPATVGDSIHWRIINASVVAHPMHLHGFYYRIDSFAGPFEGTYGGPLPGQMVVTQVMSGFAGMSMTWAPDRPGTWLFHCHVALHNMADSISAGPNDQYMRGMIGLVVAANVVERSGVRAAGDPAPVRHLRLVAVTDPLVGKHSADVPSMHFVLEEGGHRVETGSDASPELDLVRGEPVSIMIVNHLSEPTSVHWHGIEVEQSYMDGVPGVSGYGTHLTPAIAPADSFEARFTPPRSGTFMYHAHMDELRQELAGLEGALIVREPGGQPSPDDHVFLLKGDDQSRNHPAEINGNANPDTIVLHVGRAARLRFADLDKAEIVPAFALTSRPDSVFALRADTMVMQWRALAKDGFGLPAAAQTERPARQIVAMGETYDFEFTPREKGMLRLEVRRRGVPAKLLVRVPIRVE